MTIEIMDQNNLRDIYEFERDNRDFFQKSLPPRPKDYFSYDSFALLMDEILEEQTRRECAMFIIRDDEGAMAGRINLTSMGEGKGEVGYRIGEKHQGRGYATEALARLVKIGFGEYGLSLIEAGTSVDNTGSRRVLEKNGFVRTGLEKRVMKINGVWVDGFLYARSAE